MVDEIKETTLGQLMAILKEFTNYFENGNRPCVFVQKKKKETTFSLET